MKYRVNAYILVTLYVWNVLILQTYNQMHSFENLSV